MARPALPRPEAAFIGRAQELVDLAAVVRDNRLLTLVGAGGCGKTRLAIEVASRAADADGIEIVWVDLASTMLDDRVDDAMATSLGLHTVAGASRARLIEHLEDVSCLVVVDNCEHLIEAAAQLIDAVHQHCPLVHVLATSREPLSLTDEIVWRVPSLRVPDDDPTPARVLDSEAGQLLVDRIRRARPGYEPTMEDAPALVQICRQLDGIPLALELAAARTSTLPPVAVATRLAERFSLLTGGGRNLLPRQRTLEASVAWSHQLLEPDEAIVFRRLSVFAGSFELAAAVAVVGDGLPSADVAALVLRLAERSLIDALADGREPRFRMLETIRHFARQLLVDADEAVPTRAAHLRWFESVARAAGPALEGPDARTLADSIQVDIDNHRSAMTWAVESRDADALLGIVASTPWFWIWRGRMAEAIEWLTHADEPAMDPSPRAQLDAAWARQQLAVHHLSAHDDIERHSRACLALARELGEPGIEGRMLVSFGMHLGFRDPRSAIPMIEEGRALCLEHGEPFWAGYANGSVALCLEFLGRYDLAVPHLEAMARDVRALGNPQLAADHLARQSFVDLLRGNLDEVLQCATRITDVTAGLTDINAKGIALTNAAHVAVARGRATDALEATEELFARYLRDGEYQHLPGILLGSAAALTALGRADEAIERLEPMWAHPDVQATAPFRLWLRQAIAVAALSTGDPDRARTILLDAIDDATGCGSTHDAALAERFLAVIDRDEGRHHDAEMRLHHALQTHHEHGYPQHIADVLEELAGLEVDHGRVTAAATLFGATAEIRHAAGVVCRVGRQPGYEADLAALQALGDPDEVARALDTGRRTSIDDIVAFARRGRGERGRPTFGWESLTDTEARVAHLAADGLTNPQIAQDLVMGRETVKTHMASIFRKLGLRNRTELAAALHERRTRPDRPDRPN